jgi:hypothetical protein
MCAEIERKSGKAHRAPSICCEAAYQCRAESGSMLVEDCVAALGRLLRRRAVNNSHFAGPQQ